MSKMGEEVESTNHALYLCGEVNLIWQKAARWWRINLGNIGSIVELLTVSNDDDENGNRPKLWKEVVWSLLYLIWSQRNQLVFKSDRKKLEDLFLEFQRKIF